jgi:hypothetical protein
MAWIPAFAGMTASVRVTTVSFPRRRESMPEPARNFTRIPPGILQNLTTLPPGEKEFIVEHEILPYV